MGEPSYAGKSDSAPGLDPFARRVIEVIARNQKMSPEAIRLDSRFEELGFDSLDSIKIVFALEESFDVSIPDEVVPQISSIRMAVDRLRGLAGSSPLGGDEPPPESAVS